MEYIQKSCLDDILRELRQLNAKVADLEITRSESGERHNACAIFALQLSKENDRETLMERVGGTEGVLSVEEL